MNAIVKYQLGLISSGREVVGGSVSGADDPVGMVSLPGLGSSGKGTSGGAER